MQPAQNHGLIRSLRRLAWLRWPAAIALLSWLARHEGFADAIALIGRTGAVLLWLVPLHALPLLLDARAWHLLLHERIALAILWRIAVVREAVGRMLPVLGIGGDVAGIRLAMHHLHDVCRVSASVVVEALVTMAVQFLLAALGLMLLMLHVRIAGDLAIFVGASLAMALPIGIAAFVIARKGGSFEWLDSMARRLLDPAHKLVHQLDGKRLDQEIRALLRNGRLCAKALAWQFAGYASGAAEIMWALHMLGHPVSMAAAVAIEGLTQAVRNALFIAPAGLGVQETAIVAISAAFGVDREVALSLALMRRVRELAWAAIALVLLRWTKPARASNLLHERS